MGAYNSALPMLIDLVIRALGPAMPDRVAAAHYGTFSTLAYAGRHPDSGLYLAVPRQRLRRLGRAHATWTGRARSAPIAMATPG